MTAKVYKFKHAGKSYTVPTFDSLPMGAIRKSRKGTDDLDRAFIIIEAVMGEDSKELAALDAMTPSQFDEFLQGWTQGAPLGESLDS
jgi:hypothetical protein